MFHVKRSAVESEVFNMRIDGVKLTRTELTQRERVLKCGECVIADLSGCDEIKPFNIYLAMDSIKNLDSLISFEYALNSISDYEFFVYRRYIQILTRKVFKYSIGKEV